MNEITSFRQVQEQLVSLEAEQQLLGAILTNNANMLKVADALRPEHFSEPVHARIFSLAAARIAKDHLASPVIMKAAMEGDEALRDLGGPSYLVRLAGAAVSSFAVRDYAKIIIEMWIKRQIEAAITDARHGLFQSDDLGVTVTRLQHALHSLPDVQGEESSFSLLRSVTDAVMEANEAYQGRTSFLSTGIKSLDKIVRGLAPGDFMILGGTTSMGKTAAAVEIATNVAFSGGEGKGKGVAFVSLEMTREQIATRMVSARSRVPYAALRDAQSLDEADFRKFVEAAKTMEEGAMRIIPRHIRDIPAIHASCKRVNAEFGPNCPLSLIVIDYAQLVRGEGKGRYEQMTSVSIGLKTLAGMMGCPVIGLVQLDRKIGERDDRRPHLFDIKESGQFENDADQVVMCHREGYWLQRQGPKADRTGQVTGSARADWEVDMKRHANTMELIVRKNRHGRLATAEVGFHDATNRFWELERQIEGFE